MLVEATILGMGNDRLRFRRGGSVVIPHVMPFSLGLIKKVVIYTVFRRWKSFELAVQCLLKLHLSSKNR